MIDNLLHNRIGINQIFDYKNIHLLNTKFKQLEFELLKKNYASSINDEIIQTIYAHHLMLIRTNEFQTAKNTNLKKTYYVEPILHFASYIINSPPNYNEFIDFFDAISHIIDFEHNLSYHCYLLIMSNSDNLNINEKRLKFVARYYECKIDIYVDFIERNNVNEKSIVGRRKVDELIEVALSQIPENKKFHGNTFFSHMEETMNEFFLSNINLHGLNVLFLELESVLKKKFPNEEYYPKIATIKKFYYVNKKNYQ